MHILSATDTPVCGNYSAADLSRTGAKVYAAPSHGKAAPAGTSVSGQSPLSAARNEKLFHPLQLRQSLLTATVWKSAPDASA